MSRVTQIDGLPVIDAKRSITLNVISRDISSASVKEPDNCAVAKACRRELHVAEVRVHLGRVYLRTNKANWVRYVTPKGMRDEIIAFDRGGRFQPGNFELTMPPGKRVTGSRQGGPNRKNSRSGKKRRSPHLINNVRIGPA